MRRSSTYARYVVEIQTFAQSFEDFRCGMVRAVRGRADDEEVRRAVNELLQCTYRLHELLRGRPDYRRAIEGDQVGETIPALNDVRAASEHRSVLSFARFRLYPSKHLAPSEYLAPGETWEWHPTAEIAHYLPNPAGASAANRPAQVRGMLDRYERRLAGRTVLQTFDVAGDTFARFAD